MTAKRSSYDCQELNYDRDIHHHNRDKHNAMSVLSQRCYTHGHDKQKEINLNKKNFDFTKIMLN